MMFSFFLLLVNASTFHLDSFMQETTCTYNYTNLSYQVTIPEYFMYHTVKNGKYCLCPETIYGGNVYWKNVTGSYLWQPEKVLDKKNDKTCYSYFCYVSGVKPYGIVNFTEKDSRTTLLKGFDKGEMVIYEAADIINFTCPEVYVYGSTIKGSSKIRPYLVNMETAKKDHRFLIKYRDFVLDQLNKFMDSDLDNCIMKEDRIECRFIERIFN